MVNTLRYLESEGRITLKAEESEIASIPKMQQLFFLQGWSGLIYLARKLVMKMRRH